jgi:hypothetical protein
MIVAKIERRLESTRVDQPAHAGEDSRA